jgi:hypothetical protein
MSTDAEIYANGLWDTILTIKSEGYGNPLLETVMRMLPPEQKTDYKTLFNLVVKPRTTPQPKPVSFTRRVFTSWMSKPKSQSLTSQDIMQIQKDKFINSFVKIVNGRYTHYAYNFINVTEMGYNDVLETYYDGGRRRSKARYNIKRSKTRKRRRSRS